MDYRTFLAESGQQSKLDAFGPGEYEKAAASWKAGGGAGGGGGGGVDFSQVPSAMEFAQKLGVGEEGAMKDIVMQMRSQEKPLDIYGRLETEAGVPELRAVSKTLSKEIASIEDYLDVIEPDISARTRESLVTEAQRRGMVSKEREPFLEKLTKLGTGLGRVRESLSETMAGIGTKTGLAMRGQEMELEPLKMQYTAMVDRNARMMSGFTADRQTQLDILFDKLHRQRQLDDQEWQMANELAQEERGYQKTLQMTAAEAGVKLSGGESFDEMLGLIGTAAAEQIQYSRRGTAGERGKTAALISLRRDIQGGAPYYELGPRYAAEGIPMYQIREEYNLGPMAKQFGGARESAETEAGWGEPMSPYERETLRLKEAGGAEEGEYMEVQTEDGRWVRIPL